MLYEFIVKNRKLIIARTRERVASRATPRPTDAEMVYGVPLFLEQFAARLQAHEEIGASQISESASLHGGELWEGGLTIGQVVHDYGDICQVVTELAMELQAPITTDELRVLNLCLDIAIAEAVTEFARRQERQIIGQGVENLGFLAHELRNLTNTATLAFEAVRSGRIGIDGSTGRLIGKSLAEIRNLVNRALAEVRLEAGSPVRERVLVASLLEEIEIAAMMQAKGRDVQLSIEPSEPALAVDGDFQILLSIVANLVQNALKFTRPHSLVTLKTRVTSDRVLLDVADECGGLPPGKVEELFRPYEQRGTDRTGLGLGLAISLKGARALGGDLHVRDVPGTGCVFTLELRKSSV